MQLRFVDDRLGQLCNNRKAVEKKWGTTIGALMARRLGELDALDTLGDVALLPQLHLTELGERTLVRVTEDFFLELLVDTPADGKTNWTSATEATVLRVVEHPIEEDSQEK